MKYRQNKYIIESGATPSIGIQNLNLNFGAVLKLNGEWRK